MRVLLVDDEAPARSRLARLLKTHAGIEVVGEAASGPEALEKIAVLSPEVVFLDIEMPGLTGLEVAQSLGGKGPKIVFATAYDEFALKAFDLHAVDYLVKPIEAERLKATIEKLKTRTDGQGVAALAAMLKSMSGQGRMPNAGKLAVRVGAKFQIFDVEQISALSAQDHYVEITAGEKQVLADDSLDALEARLEGSGKFVRIHRSAIVNLDFLKELRREGDRKYVAVLSDYFETELAVSRESLVTLKARLGIE